MEYTVTVTLKTKGSDWSGDIEVTANDVADAGEEAVKKARYYMGKGFKLSDFVIEKVVENE